MTPPTVEIVSLEELRVQKADLLRRAGMSEAEFHRRAVDYTLSEELVLLHDELERVNYLMGE